MRNYSKITMLAAALVLSAGMVQAELVASLHMETFESNMTGLDVAGPIVSRTVNGDLNTRGTLEGQVNYKAFPGVGIGVLKSFSSGSHFKDINRFGNHANGGSLVTWDFDFTGQSSPEYNFHVDFTAEGGKPVDQVLRFYISYNDGGSLSLDTTDIKLLDDASNGGTNLVIANTAQYVPLLDLGPTAASGVLDVDITSVVNTAIANGGGIRIALVDDTFQNTIKIFKETGIQAIPEPATLGMVGLFGSVMLFIRRRMRS